MHSQKTLVLLLLLSPKKEQEKDQEAQDKRDVPERVHQEHQCCQQQRHHRHQEHQRRQCPMVPGEHRKLLKRWQSTNSTLILFECWKDKAQKLYQAKRHMDHITNKGFVEEATVLDARLKASNAAIQLLTAQDSNGRVPCEQMLAALLKFFRFKFHIVT